MTSTSEKLLRCALRMGSLSTPYTSYIYSFPKPVYVLNVSVAGVREVSNNINEFKAQARQEDNLGSTLKKTVLSVRTMCPQ